MGETAPEPMPLAALLDQVDDIPDDLTIYVPAAAQLSPTVAAIAMREPDDGTPPTGMRYLLEVSLAQDVIEVWSEWRDGRTPDGNEKAQAVIHYAQNDAYLPPE